MKKDCTATEPFTGRVYKLPDAPDGCEWEVDFHIQGDESPLYKTYVDLYDFKRGQKHSLVLAGLKNFPNPYYMGYTLLEHLKNFEHIDFTYNGYTGKEH